MHSLRLESRRRIRTIGSIEREEVACARPCVDGRLVIAGSVTFERNTTFPGLDDVQLDAIALRRPYAELASIRRDESRAEGWSVLACFRRSVRAGFSRPRPAKAGPHTKHDYPFA